MRMNPRRLLSPLSWVRFAIIVTAVGAIGTAAFLNDSAQIGWIVFALVTLYVALRVVTVVGVRRALAKAAITPPEPMSADQSERRIRQYVVTQQVTFGVFAIGAIVAAVLLPDEYSIAAWAIAGFLGLLIVAISAAAAVGRRRRKAVPQP
jgi:uncharacterized membrane protein YcaP (DUF421 family)